MHSDRSLVLHQLVVEHRRQASSHRVSSSVLRHARATLSRLGLFRTVTSTAERTHTDVSPVKASLLPHDNRTTRARQARLATDLTDQSPIGARVVHAYDQGLDAVVHRSPLALASRRETIDLGSSLRLRCHATSSRCRSICR